MPSITINNDRVGYSSVVASTQAGARGASSGDSVTNSPTSTNLSTVKFQRATFGRGTQYQYIRTFVYFDLSSISFSSINSLRLNFTTGNSSSNSGEFIVVSSTAFGGDGSSALTLADYGNVSLVTNYSAFKSTVPVNVSSFLDLNSTAISDAETDDFLILALINYDFDYLNTTATADILEQHHFNYSSTTFDLVVDYVAGGGPTNVGKWDGVQNSLIGNMNSIAYSSISKINGIG